MAVKKNHREDSHELANTIPSFQLSQVFEITNSQNSDISELFDQKIVFKKIP